MEAKEKSTPTESMVLGILDERRHAAEMDKIADDQKRQQCLEKCSEIEDNIIAVKGLFKKIVFRSETIRKNLCRLELPRITLKFGNGGDIVDAQALIQNNFGFQLGLCILDNGRNTLELIAWDGSTGSPVNAHYLPRPLGSEEMTSVQDLLDQVNTEEKMTRLLAEKIPL